MEFPAYRTIDLETWPRREHFQYFQNTLCCGYSLTARMDVTAARAFARARGLRFFGVMLYAVSKTVNSMDSTRMMIPPEGGVGIWQISHPNFTVFHPDDETFSDIWTEYQPDFDAFYAEYERVLKEYSGNHGIKARPDQPANFFCISCVPWLDYTGYASQGTKPPALFPIITYGKYTEEAGRLTLPLTLTISHAASDGYHSSLFFKKLQEILNEF